MRNLFFALINYIKEQRYPNYPIFFPRILKCGSAAVYVVFCLRNDALQASLASQWSAPDQPLPPTRSLLPPGMFN